MLRRPPRSPRTDTLFPYTTLFRSTVLFEGRLKRGPLAVAWREIPQYWVAQRWFEHRRAFYNGPLKDLTARLDLAPAEGGGCTADRSEERRVGKECVSTCRSRWSPYH